MKRDIKQDFKIVDIRQIWIILFTLNCEMRHLAVKGLNEYFVKLCYFIYRTVSD